MIGRLATGVRKGRLVCGAGAGRVRRRCLHSARTEGAAPGAGSGAAAASEKRGLATLGAPMGGVAAQPAQRRGVGVFRSAAARYQRCLDTRPLLTKMLTSGALSGVGAAAADVVTNPRNPNIDGRRAARFMLVGAFLTAPPAHLWWGFLGRRLGAGGFRTGVVKTALDTALFATPWQLCFIMAVYALERAPLVGLPVSQQLDVGTPLERTLPRMPGVMKDYVSVWVPVQLFNFTFVPLPFQVLFSNCVNAAWTCYVACATSDPEAVLAAVELQTAQTQSCTVTRLQATNT